MYRNNADRDQNAERLMAVLAKYVLPLFLFLSATLVCSAKNETEKEELLVGIYVQEIGSTEIPSIITDSVIYLSVTDLFNFLRIRNVPAHGLDTLSGFVINPNSPYAFYKEGYTISCNDTIYRLNNNEITYTQTGIYLRSDFMGKIFGLNCAFDFSSLSVTLTTKLQLPVIREKIQEEMRNNANRLNGILKADTTIGRRYSVIRAGMADWSVISTQQQQSQNDTRLNLALGGEVAGGATNISLNYDNHSPFTEKNQYYQWLYVNNDQRAVRQISAGKIFAQSVSTLFAPVAGVQFTNRPSVVRRSFGTYTIHEKTEPGWVVELYINNVLINYVKADEGGFYTFEVPLVYGTSVIKLQFYGLYGEERTERRNIVIPYNFLPEHQFEYNVSAGIVEDSTGSRFSRSDFNYGLTKHISVGAGAEYLSSVHAGQAMPFANCSVRLNAYLMMYGEYTSGVRSKAILSYHLPSSLQVELNYTQYEKGQNAINNNFLAERKLSASIPIKGDNYAAFARLSVYQVLVPAVEGSPATNTTVEGLVSLLMFGLNANITTYALINNGSQPNVYTNFTTYIKLARRLTFTPQLQYNISSNTLMSFKGEMEKMITPNSSVNLFYEKNMLSNYENLGFGFRYTCARVQTGFTANHATNGNTLVAAARGGVEYDQDTHYLELNNRTCTGKAGIEILPFLDINGNGVRDSGESLVAGLIVQVAGGHTRYFRDGTIRISDLESNMKYNLVLIPENFEEISWKIQNKVINITTDPNQYKTIEVAVTVSGEVSGTVYFLDNGRRKGMGRISVQFFTNDSLLAGQTLTEADGSFVFSGLVAGSYTARIDPAQMSLLSLLPVPAALPFTLAPKREGDVATGLEFNIRNRPKDSAATILHTGELKNWYANKLNPLPPLNSRMFLTAHQPALAKINRQPALLAISEPTATAVATRHEDTQAGSIIQVKPAVLTALTSKPTPAAFTSFNILVAVYNNETSALNLKLKLDRILKKPVTIHPKMNDYLVFVNGFTSRKDAEKTLPVLSLAGYRECLIIGVK